MRCCYDFMFILGWLSNVCGWLFTQEHLHVIYVSPRFSEYSENSSIMTSVGGLTFCEPITITSQVRSLVALYPMNISLILMTLAPKYTWSNRVTLKIRKPQTKSAINFANSWEFSHRFEHSVTPRWLPSEKSNILEINCTKRRTNRISRKARPT